MSQEEKFRADIIGRIDAAAQLIGHSFYGLRTAIKDDGAIETARRLIGPQGEARFQYGMRELKKAGLLRLSVEQALIEFGERDEIFTADEVDAARERLEIAEIIL